MPTNQQSKAPQTDRSRAQEQGSTLSSTGAVLTVVADKVPVRCAVTDRNDSHDD
jgi:hypothetical protein